MYILKLMASIIREQDPLKQGLKQLNEVAVHHGHEKIREQDPLKQGLKLRCNKDPKRVVLIREQDPLKQGLKLDIGNAIVTFFDDS